MNVVVISSSIFSSGILAAHCVIGREPNGIILVAGSVYLDQGGYRYQSSRYINHPQYDDVTLAYE